MRQNLTGSPADVAPVFRHVFLHVSYDGKTMILIEPEERISDHHATGPDA
jgi:hypothetical protein